MSTRAITRLTEDEYLELERKNEFKSEYIHGEMIAMPGASYAHVRLNTDLIHILEGQLRGGPCESLSGDMRIYSPLLKFYTYPDLSVVCGKLDLTTAPDTLLSPTLIAEILSPSTEAYDRGKKFEFYRTFDSLRQYMLIAQDRVRVDVYTKQQDGRWTLDSAGSLDDTVHLSSINCFIPLKDLYARVNPLDGPTR